MPNLERKDRMIEQARHRISVKLSEYVGGISSEHYRCGLDGDAYVLSFRWKHPREGAVTVAVEAEPLVWGGGRNQLSADARKSITEETQVLYVALARVTAER